MNQRTNRAGFTIGTLLLYFFLFFLISMLLSIPVMLFSPAFFDQAEQSSNFSSHLVSSAVMLIAVLGATLALLKIEKRPWRSVGLALKGHVKDLAYGKLFAFGFYLVGFGISLLLGVIHVVGWHLDVQSLILSWILFLLVALTEEIMMRGYVLGKLLDEGMDRFWALLTSSVLFSAMHIFNDNVSLFPMINLVLAGLLLGASYIYTRNLWFPISLHLFWNWIQGPLLGYHVSGNDFCDSLLQLELPEKNLLNGGDFGFEGSVICTVLMLLAIAVIIYWGERKQLSMCGCDCARK